MISDNTSDDPDPTPDPDGDNFSRTYLERVHERNIYTCVLAKGLNAEGQRCFAYFGIFLHNLRAALLDIKRGLPFNPADHSCIVLARGLGEPDPITQMIMRTKFSHSPDEVLLEISRPKSQSISSDA